MMSESFALMTINLNFAKVVEAAIILQSVLCKMMILQK